MRCFFAFPVVLGVVWMVAQPAIAGTSATKPNDSSSDTSLIFKPKVPEEKDLSGPPGTLDKKSVLRQFWQNMTRNQAKANKEILQRRRQREQPELKQRKGKDRKDTVIQALETFEKELPKEGEAINSKELERQGKKAIRNIVRKKAGKGNPVERREWQGLIDKLDEIPKKLGPDIKDTMLELIREKERLYIEERKQRQSRVNAKRGEGYYLRKHHEETTDEENTYREKLKEMEKEIKEKREVIKALKDDAEKKFEKVDFKLQPVSTNGTEKACVRDKGGSCNISAAAA